MGLSSGLVIARMGVGNGKFRDLKEGHRQTCQLHTHTEHLRLATVLWSMMLSEADILCEVVVDTHDMTLWWHKKRGAASSVAVNQRYHPLYVEQYHY